MPYIHEIPAWPALKWDNGHLSALLARVRHGQGRLLGKMAGLGFRLQDEAHVAALTREVVQSSAIEGERLDAEEVRSSIARKLGLDAGGTASTERAVEGIVAMMLDATQRYAEPLDAERLYGWHAALFPTGRSGGHTITVGAWRPASASPMQVVSGPLGRERVHFEAPAAEQLAGEMTAFLSWFEAKTEIDPVLKAALAHLWFVTIHPFEDGNGRIARAIADLALARADGAAERFYSMSAQIEAERKEYYRQLEQAQRGGLDVTFWMEWFLECLGRAIAEADRELDGVLRKAKLWERINKLPINPRQRQVINRLLDGFNGKLSTSKYAKLVHCSPDTALRDIKELIAQGVFVQEAGGGRSTGYRLKD